MSFLGPLLGFAGSLIGAGAQKDANRSNYEAQKEFAQNGLQWKAADAKAAGLHPMAALGAGGAGFSPSFQVGNSPDFGSLGEAADEFLRDGQNTIRAQRAGQTEHQRELEALALRRGQLENQLLEGQITQLWAGIMGQPEAPARPGAPTVGAGAIVRSPRAVPQGLIEVTPSPQESSRPGDRGAAAGEPPGFKRFHISPDTSVELPSGELADSLENLGLAGNVLGPLLMLKRDFDKRWNGSDKPSDKLLPPGHKWEWSVFRQSWRPVPIEKKRSPVQSPRHRTPDLYSGKW